MDKKEQTEKTEGLWSKGLRLLGRFVFRSFIVASMMGGDLNKLKHLNKSYIPLTQRPVPPKSFMKALWALRAASLSLLLLLIPIGLGVGTGGMGPSYVFYRLQKLKWFEFGDLMHPAWPIAMAIIILASNVYYFFAYKSKRSARFRMTDALKTGGLAAEKENQKEHWYFPGCLLHLDLVGTTGAEVVKREPVWNRAGFTPTADIVVIPSTNEVLFTAAPKKPTTSTMFYDRYEEWTRHVKSPTTKLNYFLGEYVDRNQLKTRRMDEEPFFAFIGTTGSGKTEAMKQFLLAYLVQHPHARLIICDRKGTGDWDVFAPFLEFGRVLKEESEVLMGIAYTDDLMTQRKAYMEKMGYNNIFKWSEAEGIDVPPVLLVIDEFPQLVGPLNFDLRKEKDKTPANTLFKVLTLGRSFGIWFGIGSQFGGGEYIPEAINKNTKIHVMLRCGSEQESMRWIDSGAAFTLGKRGLKLPNGEDDGQMGYGYVDGVTEYVRFWYVDNYFIRHELLKYKVPTLVGLEPTKEKEPGINRSAKTKMAAFQTEHLAKFIEKYEASHDGAQPPKEELDKHKLPVKELKAKLDSYLQGEIDKLENSIKNFRESLNEAESSYNAKKRDTKLPLGLLWKESEKIDEYYARSREREKEVNIANQAEEWETFKAWFLKR